MDRRQRSRIGTGIVLVLLGGIFLAVQLVPSLRDWIDLAFSWPLIIIGVAVFLLLLGLVTGEPNMAVPACIVGGIGGLLCWQNTTGHWDSWAYAWTLIPGFVGVGTLLSGLLGGGSRKTVREGGQLVLISLILFAVFGSFFGALGFLGKYWPVLLIGLGLLILLQGLFRSR
jgi:hypothetical protein